MTFHINNLQISAQTLLQQDCTAHVPELTIVGKGDNWFTNYKTEEIRLILDQNNVVFKLIKIQTPFSVFNGPHIEIDIINHFNFPVTSEYLENRTHILYIYSMTPSLSLAKYHWNFEVPYGHQPERIYEKPEIFSYLYWYGYDF